MAQPFNHAVMTQTGIELLNKAQAGECTIEFTRIAVGDGIYTKEEKERENMESFETLKSERGSYDIVSKEVVNDNAIILRTLISNYDDATETILVKEGFYINEIGVFAREQGSDIEVLYSVAVSTGSTGDYMPAYNGYPAQIMQGYLIAVNNAAETTIIVKNDVYALQESVDELLQKIDTIENACAKGEGIEFSVVDGILCVTYDDGTEEIEAKGDEE